MANICLGHELYVDPTCIDLSVRSHAKLTQPGIGNSIISYYLVPVLELVGITNRAEQSGINGGLAVWNLILAYIGSINAERAGRRGLFLISTIGMLASYIVITGLSGNFAMTNSKSVGTAVVPFRKCDRQKGGVEHLVFAVSGTSGSRVERRDRARTSFFPLPFLPILMIALLTYLLDPVFVYYGFYDIGWTPLPFSYTAEILPYNMRLKGLGILLSTQNVAQAFVRPSSFIHLNIRADRR